MTGGEQAFSRTAIYARYSTSIQNPTSIADQLRECRALVATKGGRVAAEYSDAAASGALSLQRRPGLRALVADCRQGRIDVVVAEALDRISRNQADIAVFFQQLRFLGIPVHTIEEGRIGAIHIGLKGTMNELFLDSLRAKVRRGIRGAVLEGRVHARVVYGYRMANRIEGARVIRGLREIDPEQADVVRRLFRLRADGMPARAIARLLNEEGLPPPRGGAGGWVSNTLLGGPVRTGMLRNPLYRGQLVYGLREAVRDPETGKRIVRIRPPEERITVEVPHLRIIDEDLWLAVQRKLDEAANPRHPRAQYPTTFVGGARPLTHVLRCGHCGGPARTIGTDRWTCMRGIKREGCSPRTFKLRDVDGTVAKKLAAWVFVRRDWNRFVQRAQQGLSRRRRAIEADITDAQRRIQRLTEAIESAGQGRSLALRVSDLERLVDEKRAELQQLAETDGPAPEPSVLRERLREKTLALRAAISDPDPSRQWEAAVTLCRLFQRIDLFPPPVARSGEGSLRIHPDLGALIRWAADDSRGSGV